MFPAVHTGATFPNVWSLTTLTGPLLASTAKLVLLQGILKGKFSGKCSWQLLRPYLKTPQPGPLVTSSKTPGWLGQNCCQAQTCFAHHTAGQQIWSFGGKG